MRVVPGAVACFLFHKQWRRPSSSCWLRCENPLRIPSVGQEHFLARVADLVWRPRSTRIRKGAPWLKTTLVQAAWGAVRVKNSYLRALFYRLKARRGAMKAIVCRRRLDAAFGVLHAHAPRTLSRPRTCSLRSTQPNAHRQPPAQTPERNGNRRPTDPCIGPCRAPSYSLGRGALLFLLQGED